MPKPIIKRTRRLASIVLIGLYAAAFSACSQDSGGTAHGIHLVHAHRLTVCARLPYKPFAFKNDAGRIIGFDVDIARWLARDLGLQLDVVHTDQERITSGAVFAAHQCDLAMGGLTITTQRRQAVRFSRPYFKDRLALLVKQDSGIADLSALANRQLGVQAGSTGEAYAKKHADQYHYTLTVFDNPARMAAAARAGRIAAALQDQAPLADQARHPGNLHIATRLGPELHHGFVAAHSGDPAEKLLKRLDWVIDEARQNGGHAARYRHWFGQQAHADSGD